MVLARTKEIARQSLLIGSLHENDADLILSKGIERRLVRGETVFLQGQVATSVHIVLDGWVKLFRIAPNGAEAVVEVFTRGGSFGEAMAFLKQRYPVSAEAVTDCHLLQVPISWLISMIQQRPEICTSILAATFQHLHRLVADVEKLKAQTGAQRVAEFLLDLRTCDDGACTVTLPYDKVLIAGRLGMKPESLSRAFSKLRTVGVRISQNHAVIADVGILRTYCEQDPAGAWSRQP